MTPTRSSVADRLSKLRVARANAGDGGADDQAGQHGDGGHEALETRWISTMSASVPIA